MSIASVPDYSSVVSATGFLRPRASRSLLQFQEHLSTSQRVLALLGAGLSASSGLPTFRGAGGLWRKHDVKQLSTPQAFEEDPALVWTFYMERRRAARSAEPNEAHRAIAELARQKPNFLAISMNIDDVTGWHVIFPRPWSSSLTGLSERAGHPPNQLRLLHGNLFDVRCTRCDLVLHERAADLAVLPLENAFASSYDTKPLKREDVPHCPNKTCQDGLLRPGVVWFTEPLPTNTVTELYSWIHAEPIIDAMLVIGTSAEVYPATAYIEAARKRGARIAVVNIEQEDVGLLALEEQDWYFEGDAAKLVPRFLNIAVEEQGQTSADLPIAIETQNADSFIVTDSVIVSAP